MPTRKPKPKAGRSAAAGALQAAAFVEAYLTNGHNATAAAGAAGLKARDLSTAGWKMLQKPAVQARLAERAHQVAELADMNLASWAAELRAIAFSRVGDVIGPDGLLVPVALLPPHVQAGIAAVKATTGGMVLQYKFWNKPAALDLMARHLGLLTAKVEVTGKDGGPIKVEDVTPVEAARRIAFVLTLGAQARDDKAG